LELRLLAAVVLGISRGFLAILGLLAASETIQKGEASMFPESEALAGAIISLAHVTVYMKVFENFKCKEYLPSNVGFEVIAPDSPGLLIGLLLTLEMEGIYFCETLGALSKLYGITTYRRTIFFISFHIFLAYVIHIKFQQISHSIRYLNYCKCNFRQLALLREKECLRYNLRKR
jgi:uncharacterized protein YacL